MTLEELAEEAYGEWAEFWAKNNADEDEPRPWEDLDRSERGAWHAATFHIAAYAARLRAEG